MSTNLDYLLEQQTELYGFISRAVENLRKVGASNIVPQRVQSRLNALRTKWGKFQANHNVISAGTKTLQSDMQANVAKLPYFTESLFSQCEELFLDAEETMTALYDELSRNAPQVTASPAPVAGFGPPLGPRLPRIELPKFNGQYSEWVPFRDLFSSLVCNNASISNVEKLQYLKSSVSRSAAQRLKNIATTEANFLCAWEDLVSYYDNKRVLIDTAMHSLFSAKSVPRESATDIEQLLSEVKQAIGALQALGRPIEHCDDFIVYIVLRKLDPNSIKDWERELGASTAPPRWEQLERFLASRVRSLQAFEWTSGKSRSTLSTVSSSRQGNARAHHVAAYPPRMDNCSQCDANHYLSSCPEYLSKTNEQRRDFLVQKRLCFNCLGPHLRKACRTKKRCKLCGAQHHTSIHRENTSGTQDKRPPSTSTILQNSVSSREAKELSGSAASNVALLGNVNRSPVLLATAIVEVMSLCGVPLEARALLDQGSEISLVTESLAQRLRLPRSRSSIPIVGIGAGCPRTSHGSISIDLRSKVQPLFSCTIQASILPKLTGNLPSTEAYDRRWPHLKGLVLADPNFAQPGKVDLVLGADAYALVLEKGIRKGPVEAPIAQRTALGWVLSGNIPSASAPSDTTARSLQCSPDYELQELIKGFWLQEEIFPDDKGSPTPEDAHCEEHFATTHSRNPDGRYVVRLPFKRSPKELGNSRTIALRMLSRLEQRFASDSDLHAAYCHFLEEYESLGHMCRVSEAASRVNRGCYLPHLSVVRPSSSTTKYRVVFNGSQKTDSGLSLNDSLHEGPKLLTDLADVITRWRAYEYVFSADIAKMFRQILIHEEDQDFQKILWRNRSGAIETFALRTVTYGLSCAPFLANRTLRQLSADESERFPRTHGIIEESTYVDDVFSGAYSIQEGREKIQEITELFKAGGFPLQKWKANRDELLEGIAPADRESSLSLAPDDGPSYRTLGLTWQRHTDTFVFTNTHVNELVDITKRTVLSCIARLFDPLGWLAPVIVQAKIFMQQLWAAQLEWDEPLPQDLAKRWREYAHQLKDVSALTVPRWLGISPSVLGIELHGFSDASHAALGVVIYVRVIHDFDAVQIALVSGKTKVAPIKSVSKLSKRLRANRITTPRLELSAAVLLVRLACKFRCTLKLEDAPIFLWTDSSTALYWIHGHPSRWKDFVRNRVASIQQMLPKARWRHVPGEENPADLASRGVSPKQLAKQNLWWQGPPWLSRHSTHWPSVIPPPEDVDIEESEKTIAHVTVEKPPVIWDLVERYSRLSRLLRITAWCLRAASRFRKIEEGSNQLPLSPEEISKARAFWVKNVQHCYFAAELKTLSRAQTLPRTSALYRLTPFVDADGMLRIGGWLRNALLDPDATHPLILPRDSIFSQLVIDHVHRVTLHGGTQIMLATLRRSYWILGGRAPVREFILRCVTCARHRATTAIQMMGQLPPSRVLPTRPFLHAGVDYAGPFTLKTWRGRAARTYKAYLVVFVCFSSSAVHLELVTDYSTVGFLAAFKRFTGRRGICASLTSDCGTNLVGADAELRRLFNASSRELADLATLLAQDGTTWKFNPPSAPHFGGKWEAAVKSVKFHIRRIVGETILTYEEFSTLLTQIEAVLNSRPICPLSDDPTDIDALTPGHFLIGSAINTIPEPSLSKLPESRLSRWQLLRQMLERFWQRWSSEYLQRFLSVSKWRQHASSLQVGTLVLVADERYPPSK